MTLRDSIGAGGFLGLLILAIALILWQLIFKKRHQKKLEKKIKAAERKQRMETWLRQALNKNYSDNMIYNNLSSEGGWSEKDLNNVAKMLKKLRKEVKKNGIQKEEENVGGRSLPRLSNNKGDSKGEETRTREKRIESGRERRIDETTTDNDTSERRYFSDGTSGSDRRTKSYFD